MQAVDFSIFVETRENPSRKLLFNDFFPGSTVFSSGIGQRKGGIAVVVKDAFLARFTQHKWRVLS